MPNTPAFLDSGRPDVPDIVVPRGVTPFYLPRRPVRGRLIRLGPLADALLTRHDNEPVVTRLAGEARDGGVILRPGEQRIGQRPQPQQPSAHRAAGHEERGNAAGHDDVGDGGTAGIQEDGCFAHDPLT